MAEGQDLLQVFLVGLGLVGQGDLVLGLPGHEAAAQQRPQPGDPGKEEARGQLEAPHFPQDGHGGLQELPFAGVLVVFAAVEQVAPHLGDQRKDMRPVGGERLPGQQMVAGAGRGDSRPVRRGSFPSAFVDVGAAVLGRVPFGDGVLLQPGGLENRGRGEEAVDFFMEFAVDLVQVGETLGQLLVAGQAVDQVGFVVGAAGIGQRPWPPRP